MDEKISVINQVITDKYSIYNGDSCELLKHIPSESIGYSVFSPPFAELYTYSNSDRDLGNSENYDEFFKHFKFIADELFRVIQQGRLCTIHCIDIPMMKERDGQIGLKDFPGDIIRLFKASGFIYHSRNTIWKDPLIEATRTKALGLMHKTIQKDSSMCRSGLPDYLVTFRKPGENKNMISHTAGFTEYIGENKPKQKGIEFSHHTWRSYASPVWMDIRQTRTLNVQAARSPEDEKHICPLQLDTIERCLNLWSKEDDIVLSPFMGIGSEGYCAVQIKRKFIGIELKESYFNQAIKNLENITSKKQSTLFE